MKATGNVHKYGDHVDTDAIIAARYLNTSDPDELAGHCMQDIDGEFVERARPGDVIVAGRNFGCGSSREHAPIAIKAAGISAVIAANFARIFYRNALNIGLPIIESPEAAERINAGDEITVDTEAGTIEDHTTGESFSFAPLTGIAAELVEAGGLVELTRRKLAARA
ncbi:MAG TPA: 3-isopropylmalate dehydratase small subunit [Armatimonadota bacterium]|nr:3-isopropylmalate dehydratase small subunit [Armatimonadota bacterium]